MSRVLQTRQVLILKEMRKTPDFGVRFSEFKAVIKGDKDITKQALEELEAKGKIRRVPAEDQKHSDTYYLA